MSILDYVAQELESRGIGKYDNVFFVYHRGVTGSAKAELRELFGPDSAIHYIIFDYLSGDGAVVYGHCHSLASSPQEVANKYKLPVLRNGSGGQNHWGSGQVIPATWTDKISENGKPIELIGNGYWDIFTPTK